MPPVSVVQVLSRNGVASVGLVKEWLMARIKSAREEVEMVRPRLCFVPCSLWLWWRLFSGAHSHQSQDQQLILSYRMETQAKLRQVEELADPDKPRVFHVTQCAACQGGLDLPAVHFMCNHSYHQRCVSFPSHI